MEANTAPLTDIEEVRRMTKAKAEDERAQFQGDPEPEQSEGGNGHDTDQAEDYPTHGLRSKFVMAWLHANEDGDAKLLVELLKGRFMYDHAAGVWYKWNGHYWVEDFLNEVMAGVEEVISVYGLEAHRQAWQRLQAEKSGNQDRAKKHERNETELYKRVRALQTLNRKKNVLELARIGKDGLGISGEEWDRDPWLLGCLNGVLELKTRTFRPGGPEDYIKTIAPVLFLGPDEPAPNLERFLLEVFGGDREMVSFLQRLLGYGLIGESFLHILVIFWGKGRNGKTTVFEILKFVLGPLAHKTRSETLLDQRYQRGSGAPDADTLELRGKRVVYATETKAGDIWNTGKLKELVGGDTQNARAPFGKRPVEFKPSYLLFVSTNDKPSAPASDYAFWERLTLIPFMVSFVTDPKLPNERKADPHLLDTLKAEASGVLAWLVRGCLDFQKEGLNPPEAVRAATEQYRNEEDIVGQFIEEKCVLGPTFKVKAGDLFKAYQKWETEMGLKTMTGRKFLKEIKTRFDCYKTNYVFFIGLGLLDE
jgi:putative DNA primase/helicase